MAGCFLQAKGGGLREFVWVGGCVTAPVAWASGSSAPPGRASGRGYAGVYTDRRKWALGATRLTRRVRPLVTSRWRRWCKMRFSVRVRTQNALFRRVRFSSPAQTWSHLTQRRILRRRSHVKAQSAPATSRKGALCTPDLTEKRTLCPAHTQNALFRDVEVARPPRMRFSVRVTLPECAFP